MELNGTLLMQMGNFLLVYFVLKKFLFPYVIEAISSDKKQLDDIHNQIVDHANSVAKKEAVLVSRWQQARKFFQKHAPSLKPISRILHYTASKDAQNVDPATRTELEKTIEQHLIKGVDSVDT